MPKRIDGRCEVMRCELANEDVSGTGLLATDADARYWGLRIFYR
jgi:hypothetical protein